VLSALLMFQRASAAFRYAIREEDFLRIFTAGVALVVIGTLVLQDGWLKIVAVFYQLLGIGIIVEILRRMGAGFVASREEHDSS
jgi:diacylglycerol kinase